MQLKEEKEIEIGEYIRTDSGYISRVLDTEKGSVKIKSDYREWIGICCIKKHSHNLIDLIEVGDILKIQTGLYDYFMKIIEDEDDLLVLKEQIKKYWRIKEVLSHEQYDWNCFSIDE